MPLTAKTQLPKEHHILIYEVQSHHEVLLDVLELKFSLNRNSLLNFQKKIWITNYIVILDLSNCIWTKNQT